MVTLCHRFEIVTQSYGSDYKTFNILLIIQNNRKCLHFIVPSVNFKCKKSKQQSVFMALEMSK